MLEVLFVTPNNSNGIYQELSNKYSAIETPTWSLLLAQSCRTQNYIDRHRISFIKKAWVHYTGNKKR